MTTNFRGKDILESLQNIKLETDRKYFERQTYDEFVKDPLGGTVRDKQTNENEIIVENRYAQKMQDKLIQTMITNVMPQKDEE